MTPGPLLFGALCAAVGAAVAAAFNRERLEGLGEELRSRREAHETTQETARDLAKEADRLRTVLAGIEDGILAITAEQRIALANPAALQLLELAQDPSDRLLVEVLQVPEAAELLADSREGRSSEVEFDLGARRLNVRAHPYGRGTVLSIRDVTDLRHLERIRRDFVANVSHELRTPVTVISTHAETLLDSALEDPVHARRFVEGIHRHADRLTRLVSDLLDLSRIEAGRRTIEVGEVDVATVVQGVTAGLAASAETRGVELTAEVSPQLRVAADADALDQVLLNLLENAIKYTPEGGTVDLRVSDQGDVVRFEVVDDGPGVPPKHRARLFERFYRVDKGRSRDAGGTGLGLSIVKHLVESMVGRVGYEARDPRGSVFWVELPTHSPPTRPGHET
ncbi:MAG: PAS domain-containing protein [Proteobacteria bacterium]|nr:PAS domain-containing protein [Pseudomonadota bacterium]